ncbi:isochorismatase family protein [Duganella callida]|nr:isochorismatase family protein [Duganella callida]
MRRALIVIDVQNEYVTGQMPIEYPPLDVSLPNIALAMDAAQAAGIPVVVVQHDLPPAAPVFAIGSKNWELHPVVAERPATHRINKNMASVFTGTDLADWLAANRIDTLTIVGYMTHNCNAATIYEAAHRGFNVEVLSDATGALPYQNAAGKVTAEEMHRVFSTVFHSNFAAVVGTRDWIAAAEAGREIGRDNLFLSNQRARGLA